MMDVRKNIPELMDDPTITDGRIDSALQELSVINRWLGGFRVSRLGIRRIIGSLPPDRPVTVLDIGAGGSDLSRILASDGRPFEVTALDVNFRAGEYARKHGRAANVVIGSAHALPFRDRSFDIVHASLFLHHCTDEQARALLTRLSRIARYGIVINDLHRHPLAYAGIYLLTRVFSRSSLVRHDGPISVLRGFLRSEFPPLFPPRLQAVVSITWHWAFRWCVCILLTGAVDGATVI